MPPKRASAARGQAPTETDTYRSNIRGDQKERVGNESVSNAPGKKNKRRNRNRINRGSKPGRNEIVEDADGVETESVGEAEREEAGSNTTSPPSDTDTLATEPLSQFRLGRESPQTPKGTFVEVPILAHYELRELPSVDDDEIDDDAINDEGLFATQHIEAGTRIISEQPLLTLPAPGDSVPQLMAAYENLSKPDQDAIWNLRPAAATASDALMNLRYLTDALHTDLQRIEHTPEASRTLADHTTLLEMSPKLQYAAKVYRIAARWHANRSSLLNTPLEQRAHLPNGTPITGLFIARARIRHSCVPNCFASYDPDRGAINVHVTRAIAPGEELTCAAFADTMYYRTAADRAEELRNWGLACACEACDAERPEYALHEGARTRAHTRVVLLTDVLTRLEEGEDMDEDTLTSTQKLLLDLIRDLKTSGCESAEIVRWRNILVDRILPARARVVPRAEVQVVWRVCLEHARESERVGGVCFGGDRGEVMVLREMRERVEGVVGMLESGEEE